jgi:thiol-disulfide isomerase/thioredoxin
MNNRYKLSVLLLFALALTSAKGQTFNKFNLNGVVSGVKDGTIELYDHYGDDPDIRFDHRKVTIAAGKFEFSGEMTHPFMVYLFFYDVNGKKYNADNEFFIDPGKEQLVCTVDSLHNLKTVIKGSRTDDDYQNEYLPFMNGLDRKLYDWHMNYSNYEVRLKADAHQVLADSLENLHIRIKNQIDSAVYNYSSLHRKSYLALWILDARLNARYSNYYQKAYLDLSKEIKNCHLGKTVAKTIDGMKQTVVGTSLQDMNLVDTTFTAVNISFKTGNNSKYLFVDLWFSHCAPCRAEFPDLIKIYNKYNALGLEVIGISALENNKLYWQKSILTEQLPWPQYFDKNGIILHYFHILNFPSNFLVDPQGKIIAKDLRPFQLEEFLTGHIALRK